MRLVDADALQYSDARDMLPTGQYITREEINKVAEPVVRCKDCKYCEPNGQYGCKCYHYKLYETHEMSPNDFCSRAERREVDAEPTRHGRWLWVDGVRCSICNHKLQTTGLMSYCPNCGAKMDEGNAEKCWQSVESVGVTK